MTMDIKTFLKEEIKNMKPKTVFKLTDIYSGDNPKDAGKKLSELVNVSTSKSPSEEILHRISSDGFLFL